MDMRLSNYTDSSTDRIPVIPAKKQLFDHTPLVTLVTCTSSFRPQHPSLCRHASHAPSLCGIVEAPGANNSQRGKHAVRGDRDTEHPVQQCSGSQPREQQHQPRRHSPTKRKQARPQRQQQQQQQQQPRKRQGGLRQDLRGSPASPLENIVIARRCVRRERRRRRGGGSTTGRPERRCRRLAAEDRVGLERALVFEGVKGGDQPVQGEEDGPQNQQNQEHEQPGQQQQQQQQQPHRQGLLVGEARVRRVLVLSRVVDFNHPRLPPRAAPAAAAAAAAQGGSSLPRAVFWRLGRDVAGCGSSVTDGLRMMISAALTLCVCAICMHMPKEEQPRPGRLLSRVRTIRCSNVDVVSSCLCTLVST